jgi:iron complex transport system ATP-binding protein
MLELNNLNCGYGTEDILRGISLRVNAGEFLCVAGPNGCGKSTLLKAIARLLPFRGNIAIEGRDSAGFSRKELARHIALLGQVSPLYFPYTVYDTVAMGRYARRKGWFGSLDSADAAAIENVLTTLGLDPLREKPINELSGGQLQLVFLARSSAQEPRVILLDEPTSHLDIKHQLSLLDHLASWVRAEKRTVISVFHDLNLALRYSNRVILIADGTIAAQGPAAEVLSGSILKGLYGMDTDLLFPVRINAVPLIRQA